MSGTLSFRQKDGRVTFERAAGGFPSWLGFEGPEETETVSQSDRPWLSVELPGGIRRRMKA